MSSIHSAADIHDILPYVDQASRYIGTEINAIRKDAPNIRLNIALAFPDLYEIGTSHFGLQILYHILNQNATIRAERLYAPGLDLQHHMKKYDIPLMSLESKRPINTFDIVGFSLLYELTYTNLIAMLDLARIPLRSSERDVSFPFIIAGGPCTCNPEPVADFFDAMVFGDGEEVIMELASAWMNWKVESPNDKQVLLYAWSRIKGVYIPSFFQTTRDAFGFQKTIPLYPDYNHVDRTIVSNFDLSDFPSAPIVPFGKPVHDRLRLEISRGCSRGCRFCQAGIIYRPVRERSVSTLLNLAKQSIEATGYEDISLLSLSTGDYTDLSGLMSQLMGVCEPLHISVSLPSIRADKLSSDLMKTIKRVRKTGFTIAPEAGSQRLRNVINKNLSQDNIVQTVRDAFELGWKVIKLYFMVGHPTETDADIQAITELIHELRKIQKGNSKKSRSPQIHISLTSFIPKPHTPFQWASQISIEAAKDKFWTIKNRCKISGVEIKWQNPEVSLLEGLFARGDRSFGNLLALAWQKGCRFDGWCDHFRFDIWKQAIEELEIVTDFYISRNRHIEEPLPWDHIHSGVSKTFLAEEWQKALEAELTQDCRDGSCHGCGVCDFKSIKPELTDPGFGLDVPEMSPVQESESSWEKQCFLYSKTGEARYLGHLEVYNTLNRAFRKSHIPVQFSSGFHPKPKFSFFDALPVGMEALHERFVVSIKPVGSCAMMTNMLNRILPSGMCIETCFPAAEMIKDNQSRTTYEVFLTDALLKKEILTLFDQSSSFPVSRTNHKGICRELDLKQHILEMVLPEKNHLLMTVLNNDGFNIRPGDILLNLFHLNEQDVRRARVIKHGTLSTSLESLCIKN
ncbi:MAG TPA: TIGR03960 family B12-binding radical SAM protein [Desulfatirhabdiaceae bacterium]|nr:TIGR03960 family B12-binding radical SAM protein [Desulfatirhabdiaceae bacterium]